MNLFPHHDVLKEHTLYFYNHLCGNAYIRLSSSVLPRSDPGRICEPDCRSVVLDDVADSVGVTEDDSQDALIVFS